MTSNLVEGGLANASLVDVASSWARAAHVLAAQVANRDQGFAGREYPRLRVDAARGRR
jgi:glycine cleavage system pyridoxal-binding protein P